MDFNHLNAAFRSNFDSVVKNEGVMLFETDADKDYLWNLYLDSFPAAKNPIFRVRREYDCSCCRHFIREIGHVVYIKDNVVHSIFDMKTGDPDFQYVFDALNAYVTSRKITDYYITKNVHTSNGEQYVGQGVTRAVEDGNVVTYDHYFLKMPRRFIHHGSKTIDTVRGMLRDQRNVFKRSLDEISLEAIDTVMELINSNTLYRGAEWKHELQSFRQHKVKYDKLNQNIKELYCWTIADTVGGAVGRIRNHSIGKLLTDITDGMELDAAVRSYEQIVAPANYKRPKAIFTKRMLEDAQKKMTELGYLDSLPRRFATLDDITVNNILFSNRDAAKRIAGVSVFDQMKADVAVSPKQFSRVEEIPVDKFISDVLPTASEVEAFLENRHRGNLVSLIAPAVSGSKSMFKWDNAFSWAYTGNVTDSTIRENVKNAGGNVSGVLRFSIQWNDIGEYDGNDLDAHCYEPGHNEIAFYSKVSYETGGSLDVDIIHPNTGKPAVENIVYPVKNRMKPGNYDFFVHCYSQRGGKSGFRAEIAMGDEVFQYNYDTPMRNGQSVKVATVKLDRNGKFTIEHHLPEGNASSIETWGVKTNTFVPVSVVMFSPNYWDEQNGNGNKHYIFALNGCVNDENPNGFYNEFLKSELLEHKRVLEALGGRMSVADVDDQLSGIGFSSTMRNSLVVRVKGATERVMKIIF